MELNKNQKDLLKCDYIIITGNTHVRGSAGYCHYQVVLLSRGYSSYVMGGSMWRDKGEYYFLGGGGYNKPDHLLEHLCFEAQIKNPKKLEKIRNKLIVIL